VLFVFVETEIWPALLVRLHGLRIPSALVNGRISARSFPRYRRILGLMAPALSSVDVVCARDLESEQRLVGLGAIPDTVSCTGDMKLDALDADAVSQAPSLLLEYLQGEAAHDRVLVAASTREGEDEEVLRAFALVRRTADRVRLVIAPRHPERFDDVYRSVVATGLSVTRRSQAPSLDRSWDILLVDTLGELRGFFKGATAAFVGGSLVPVGTHNVLEPAAFGVPVVVGRHLEEVRDAARALEGAGALEIVADADELARVWTRWLADPSAAQAAGRAGAAIVTGGRGAVLAVMERLEPILMTLSSSGNQSSMSRRGLD
jgi:3-deoxy-D-manno-octulosonic-acid transferase